METKETFNIIPDLYYDLISRLIPGGLLVIIYFPQYLTQTLNFQMIVFAIILSYVVGFILNILSGFLWRSTYYSRPKIIVVTFGNVPYNSMHEIWQTVIYVTGTDKVHIKKKIAECLMFRSLSIEFFCFLIVRPTILDVLSNFGFILFLFSWWFIFSLSKIYIHRSISSTIKHFKALAVTDNRVP